MSNYGNECISCKNLPYTWGSIYNATDINTNTTVADSITMALPNAPVTQFTPSLSNVHQNPRETIWGNYSGFTLPSSINMQFVLPHPSAIGCCTLYVKICVKFTFRDRNCKECEVTRCITIAIPPAAQHGDNPNGNGGVDNPTGTTNTGVAKEAACATCGVNNANSNNGNMIAAMPVVNAATQDTAPITDEELIKMTEQKIDELKQLKEKGFKRGDVELLSQLEKQLATLKERMKTKK